MRGVNLNVFDFDYDLEWAGLFLNADETVYGRFSGQKADAGDSYLTLNGLAHAMQAALARHRQAGQPEPQKPRPAGTVEQYPAAKRLTAKACIHCHQVYDYRREAAVEAGTFRKDDVWVYPLPENLGLTLDPERGDRIKAVRAGSAAARSGMRPGDALVRVNEQPVASVADVQYALHRAPAQGEITLTWQRDGMLTSAQVPLAAGWRQTDLSWRGSTKRLGPDPSLHGSDLTAAEKKALGLAEKQLAFYQGNFLSVAGRQAGLRQNDIIVGVDRKLPEMTVGQFLLHLRLDYQAGDTITLHILRAGQRLDLPLTLPRRMLD